MLDSLNCGGHDGNWDEIERCHRCSARLAILDYLDSGNGEFHVFGNGHVVVYTHLFIWEDGSVHHLPENPEHAAKE